MSLAPVAEGPYLFEFAGLPQVMVRRYRQDDVDHLYEAARESLGPGFSEYMPWAHADYKRQESLEYVGAREAAWERGEDFALAVFDENERYLGATGLNQIQTAHGYANLGYWIRRSAWGRGYAVPAALSAARVAFEQLGLVRAEIVIAVGNEKSRRVAEKARARHEGVLRNRLRLGGIQYDAHMYSLVPGDGFFTAV